MTGFEYGHMAPVTGAIADGEEDQLVLLFCLRNRFLAPWVPIDRIVGVLQEIGAGGMDQPLPQAYLRSPGQRTERKQLPPRPALVRATKESDGGLRPVHRCEWLRRNLDDARSIGDVEIHAVESVAGHLRPDAVFLHRNLVHLHVLDLELAGLLVRPTLDKRQ
jgi:hypothetical protein